MQFATHLVSLCLVLGFCIANCRILAYSQKKILFCILLPIYVICLHTYLFLPKYAIKSSLNQRLHNNHDYAGVTAQLSLLCHFSFSKVNPPAIILMTKFYH